MLSSYSEQVKLSASNSHIRFDVTYVWEQMMYILLKFKEFMEDPYSDSSTIPLFIMIIA